MNPPTSKQKYYHQKNKAQCLIITQEHHLNEKRQYLAFFNKQSELFNVWIDEDDLQDYREQLERFKVRKKTGVMDPLDANNWETVKAYFRLKENYPIGKTRQNPESDMEFTNSRRGPNNGTVKKRKRRTELDKLTEHSVVQKTKIHCKPIQKESCSNSCYSGPKIDGHRKAKNSRRSLIVIERQNDKKQQKGDKQSFVIPKQYEQLEVSIKVTVPCKIMSEEEMQRKTEQINKKQEVGPLERLLLDNSNRQDSTNKNIKSDEHISRSPLEQRERSSSQEIMDSEQNDSLISLHKSDPSPGYFSRSSFQEHQQRKVYSDLPQQSSSSKIQVIDLSQISLPQNKQSMDIEDIPNQLNELGLNGNFNQGVIKFNPFQIYENYVTNAFQELQSAQPQQIGHRLSEERENNQEKDEFPVRQNGDEQIDQIIDQKDIISQDFCGERILFEKELKNPPLKIIPEPQIKQIPKLTDFNCIQFKTAPLQSIRNELQRRIDGNTLTWTDLQSGTNMKIVQVKSLFQQGSLSYVQALFWMNDQLREKFILKQIFEDIYGEEDNWEHLKHVKVLQISLGEN